ncbi:MAG TPA: tRNA (N6-isopentenyl adenosine(37)-C2)-methylthiotransferase MiaB [Candidatus Acidoferrales bacterium]|nr:tRNA (N6-isopentenyl adenosine(37)-C2)-methylthiotransferase MiaB [Candidatus Acidoferrales bacterium]
MGKSFDIGLERLVGAGVAGIGATQDGGVPFANDAQGKKPPLHDARRPFATQGEQDAGATGSTFYLETFGCQMNDHDSEKVAGVLLARGYRQVDGPEAAKVILYNTCSIREKAAQKVFSRLGELRPVEEAERKWIEERELGLKRADLEIGVPGEEDSEQRAGRVKTRRLQSTGKIIGVLGCVAQQEGEGIFERAPWVSLVCGSASYRKLPQLIAELEAGNRRVTGLDTDTDETFETEITRRDNPFRAYLTIIEGCDKACSYCVVPFTRGPERSRASGSILEEVRRLAEAGYSEVQLLGQTVNSYADPSARKMRFSELLATVADVRGIRRVRFTTSHPRDFGKDIVEAIEAHPTICDHVHLPVQSGSTAVLRAMARRYSREEYLEKIALMKAARRPISITTDMIVGFPGETEKDFEETLSLLDEVQYDSVFAFKYSPRPNTPSLKMADAIPEEEKGRRLGILMDRQREIQRVRNEGTVGETFEVLVDGKSRRENQWSGHTSSNRVMNFTSPEQELLGNYVQVKVVSAMPNSLVGEMVGRT